MNVTKNGISIGIERSGNEFYLLLRATGKLTHEDFEIITPMIESSLEGINDPKVKVLVDGTEMEGWKLGAAWDDFKLLLKHGSKFEKVAIYGNKNWHEITAKMGSWFINGEVKYFDRFDEAVAWLHKNP
jgi:hypothetical protein